MSLSAVEFLSKFVTQARQNKIEQVLSGRTRSILPILEDIYDRGNLHAVVRTAEALGFCRLGVIQTTKEYKSANRVTQGTHKWMDIERHTDTRQAIEGYRNEGYQIWVSDLSPSSVPLGKLDFSQKAAVVFGNEKDGASSLTKELADLRFRIPISGFAESFNVSVAAAITLYHAATFRENWLGSNGDLEDSEIVETRRKYLEKSVAHSDLIIKHYSSLSSSSSPSPRGASSSAPASSSSSLPSGLSSSTSSTEESSDSSTS